MINGEIVNRKKANNINMPLIFKLLFEMNKIEIKTTPEKITTP